MREEKIVQFVCFETALNPGEIMSKLEDFIHTGKNDQEFQLQRAEKDGSSKYLVQHSCKPGEFQFIFLRTKRSPKSKETPLTVEQAGGYSYLEFSRTTEARRGESKLFLFLVNLPVNLETYKKCSIPHELNIYQPYYENCRYACILEYFTKDKHAAALLDELKQHTTSTISIFKECQLQLN